MRVDIRGTIYESVPEAAKAVNRSPQTVYRAIDRGRTDQLGLGPVHKYKRTGNQCVGTSKPQCVSGVWFPSISALARFIGKDKSHTRVALNKGGRAYRNLEDRVRNAEKTNHP